MKRNQLRLCLGVLILVGCGTTADERAPLGQQKEELVSREQALTSDAGQDELERRRANIREHFQQQLDSLDIIATTVMPSGQVLDWIPQPDVTPPHPPEDPAGLTSGPDGGEVLPVSNELIDNPDLRGPEGTVPIVRFDVESYLTSVRDEVPASIGEMFPSPSPVACNPPMVGCGRYYVSRIKSITTYGAAAGLNVWNTTGPFGTDHSISQVAVTRGSTVQSVEAGRVEMKSLNGNSTAPFLFVYYTTNGYDDDGDNIGGYNQLVTGWVQTSGTWYPGALISPTSVWGSSQYEMHVAIEYQNASLGGRWWVVLAGIYIGYYPATLFSTSGLRNNASTAYAFGEVFDSYSPNATSTDMGAPGMGSEGWAKAAYIRNFAYYPSIDVPSIFTSGNMPAASVTDSSCYSNSGPFYATGNFQNYWYYGGDGNEETGCN